MNLELSIEQYEALLKLIFIGDWVMSFSEYDNPEPGENRMSEIAQYIYGQADTVGLGHLVTHDQNSDALTLTREFEEGSGITEILEYYEEETFWEELIHRLAHRDFYRHFGETAISEMAIEERIEKETPFVEKYATEFNENGLENLKT
ncbi:hypothetical protein [Leptospira sp. GIMC2001]|uniref:hypothetical protein n=1 Tax=Leptospira sp. GIMC2001 TaxID=1513297 RepID=UPI00234B9FE5|nr:hypothetical protein [Leptospira sp. GIMC2001]WCL50354.1 hypothetical protein O4O04_05925 [Leptospira sp. GIMC2001]